MRKTMMAVVHLVGQKIFLDCADVLVIVVLLVSETDWTRSNTRVNVLNREPRPHLAATFTVVAIGRMKVLFDKAALGRTAEGSSLL